jgi:hypothetical protein
MIEIINQELWKESRLKAIREVFPEIMTGEFMPEIINKQKETILRADLENGVIRHGSYEDARLYRCPLCKQHGILADAHYCAQCGAKIRKRKLRGFGTS